MLIDSGCKIRYFIDGNNIIMEIFLKNIAGNEKIRIFAAAFDAINPCRSGGIGRRVGLKNR